ncbi:MAG TPA: glycosyltransferase [Terriglobales bacterium]|nr:glycosyltransferase [Terriglobales bacterium]
MHEWAIGGGVLALAIWIYLAALRGGFWRVRADDAPADKPQPARVVAVIPARDEAKCIAETVRSLLQQEFSGDLRVIVVDDGSSDGTAEVARRAAEDIAAATRLTIIAGSAPPSGWTGKLWSVQQGIAAARAHRPDYLLLTDADIRHHQRSVAQLVTRAGSGYDLVSHMVRLHCSSFAERLLIPAFVYFFFMLYPPAWIDDARRRTAGAAGGCMLVRPAALDAAGGIEAVRSEIIDDCALARAIKRSGARVWLGLTAETKSMRPYGSFAEIGRMISRTAFNQLGHSVPALLVCVVGLGITFVLPPALLASRRGAAALLGVAAWMLMTVTYAPMVRFYRLNLLWALTLPLAAIFYLGATVDSALQYCRGRGGRWKGRVQDPAAPPA